MSSRGVVVAADVHDILQQVQRRRGPGLLYRSPEAGDSVAATARPFYAPTIMLSEPQRAPPPPRTERDVASSASGATRLSPMFDSWDNQSAYSASTAPPRRGPEPLHLQRAPVPDFATSWLPCEFRKLSGCQERFALDNVEPWIEHIVDEHLHGILPKHCICWFCDEAKFWAASGWPEDKFVAYRRRMRHIANHFRDGKLAADVRWDFNFLDHVYDHGLISENVFRWAARQSEVTTPKDMVFADPRPVRPRGEEQGGRRRRHGRQRDPTRPHHMRRIAE